MSTNTNVKRKCDSCFEWVNGKPKMCPHCQNYLDHRVRENEQKLAQQEKVTAEKKEAFEAKPPIIRLFIQIGNVFEFIFISITGFIAWLLFWLGG